MMETDSIKTLIDLTEEYFTVNREVKGLKDQLRKKATELADIEGQLFNLLTSAGLPSFKTESGTVWPERTMVVSVNKKNKENLFNWLEEQGAGDLVTHDVHHRRLTSFIKEMLDEGLSPSELPEFIYLEQKRRIGHRSA